MAKNDHITVNSTRVIEYPEQWADKTGPFGGAYQWALENMIPNTEVLGVRCAQNSHKRTELYKFRLILGSDGEVRGKMELENGQTVSLKGGHLGIVARNEEWSRRYVLVNAPEGGLRWVLEWERVVDNRMPASIPPYTAAALISKCSELVNMMSRPLRRNWCREVFSASFDQLRTHRVLREHVTGVSTERHHRLYAFLLENYGQAIRAHLTNAEGHDRTFTAADMDDLVKASRIILCL